MEKLLQLLTELHPETDFNTKEALIDDCVLDSFDIVTLVADIDENFGVVIGAGDIVPENFNSARALYALIERLRAKKAK